MFTITQTLFFIEEPQNQLYNCFFFLNYQKQYNLIVKNLKNFYLFYFLN